jgi:hypothetical protein
MQAYDGRLAHPENVSGLSSPVQASPSMRGFTPPVTAAIGSFLMDRDKAGRTE